MNVRSLQHETLDALCYRVLGNTRMLEQVMVANPHLTGMVTMASGQQVHIPDVPAQVEPKQTINLWD
ncbi:MAG: tail protein X [Pseudomonadota bacterium]